MILHARGTGICPSPLGVAARSWGCTAQLNNPTNRMKRPAEIDLFSACCEDRADDVRQMLRDGADPNQRHECGLTPLWAVSALGNVKAAAVLVAGGADLNGLSEWTVRDNVWPHPRIKSGGVCNCACREVALQIAVDRLRGEIVDLLIRAGADPHRGDKVGMSPFVYAAGYATPMLQRMIALGVDPHVEGHHALDAAASAFNVPSVKLLVEAGVHPVSVRVNWGCCVKMTRILRAACVKKASALCLATQPGLGTDSPAALLGGFPEISAFIVALAAQFDAHPVTCTDELVATKIRAIARRVPELP